MHGSLKEQSTLLEFAKLSSYNIWRWKKKIIWKVSCTSYETKDPSPKMKKNIFVLFSGLISKSKSEIKSMKNHIFWWGVAWLLANNLRNPLPDFISFFTRALGFPQIMSNVCCDSTKHEPILSFCSILLTNWWNIRKKNQF